MVQVILVRPGTTDFDEQGRITGNLDIPLNRFGADQVARTTNELAGFGIQVVYSAPSQAAEETAQAIAEGLGIKTKTSSHLRNLDHGLWQGKLIDEVKAKQPKVYRQWKEQPETVCPPEGEMLESAQQRVQRGLEKLLKKHKSGIVAMVVAEPLASLVRYHLGHGELGEFWHADSPGGDWEAIQVPPEKVASAAGR